MYIEATTIFLFPAFDFSLFSFCLPSRGILFLLRAVWTATTPGWNYIIDTAKFTSVYIRHSARNCERGYTISSWIRERSNRLWNFYEKYRTRRKLFKKYIRSENFANWYLRIYVIFNRYDLFRYELTSFSFYKRHNLIYVINCCYFWRFDTSASNVIYKF